MKKLYLHIGASKTGTTSLQSHLTYNRDWLRERGYLYPYSEKVNHHPLVQSVLAGRTDYYSPRQRARYPDYKVLWGQLRDELDRSDCSVVLLSSEMFPNLAHSSIRHHSVELMGWLGDQFLDFDVRVVCYLRPLDAFMRSYYKYVVKDERVSLGMADWIDQQIERRSIYASPTVYLDLFAEQFGAENLILCRYDRENLLNSNVIDDFCALVDLPLRSDGRATEDKHPSLPDDMVDMKRIHNSVAYGTGDPVKKGIGRTMAKLPATAFGVRPVDNAEAIHQALKTEHCAIKDRYDLDLGDVGDPFIGTQPTMGGGNRKPSHDRSHVAGLERSTRLAASTTKIASRDQKIANRNAVVAKRSPRVTSTYRQAGRTAQSSP